MMSNLPSLIEIGSYDMIVLQVLLLAGIIGAITAKAKGRSGFLWFLLSVVTCGAGILLVLFMPIIHKASDSTPKDDDGKA